MSKSVYWGGGNKKLLRKVNSLKTQVLCSVADAAAMLLNPFEDVT